MGENSDLRMKRIVAAAQQANQRLTLSALRAYVQKSNRLAIEFRQNKRSEFLRDLALECQFRVIDRINQTG